MSDLYTEDQAEWCRKYTRATTFEPLMEDYEEGNETFSEAKLKSIHWFEDFCTDALNEITK